MTPAPDLPPLFVDGRIDLLRTRLEDLDAVVVASLSNLRWLTGFTGSNRVSARGRRQLGVGH